MNSGLAFAGNLAFLNLGELLQLLGTTVGTGTLRITSKYFPDTGLIYIEKGNPINAAIGQQMGLEAIYALFGWTDGQFEFIQEDINVEKIIKQSRMELILDGLRLLDEGKTQKVGPAAKQQDTGSETKSSSLPLIKGPLVDYTYVVDEESFYGGDEIVREGNHGDWIWVILEGVVEIMKESDQGQAKMLRLGDGAFLGSVASLLAGNNVRSATITAIGNVQLGMLDSQQLSSELVNRSNDYKNLVKCLDQRLKQVTSTAFDIYLKTENMTEWIKNKKPVIKQGQKEDRLFKIVNGEAIVARETDQGILPLVRLAKGDFFGNMPFLDMGHEPDSASVFSSPDLKLSTVDVEVLKNENKAVSSTLRNILEHLASCISVTSLLACDYYKRQNMNQ